MPSRALALDLTTLLAEFIRFEYRSINIKGQDDATVTFRAIVPDTYDPASAHPPARL